MKKIFSIVTAAVVLLAAGCVKLEEELILKENGSGTLELNYSIAEQTVSQIQAMNKLRGEMATASSNAVPNASTDWPRFLFDPQKDAIVMKLKEYEPLGIVTEKVDLRSRDIRRNVNIKVRFNSLEALAKTDFFRQFGFAVKRHSSGAYIFERPPSSSPDLVRPDFSAADTVRMVSPLMSGFSVTFKMVTPGRIVDTSGTMAGPYSTAWTFDFDRDPNALTALRNHPFRVVFDGTGLVLPEIALDAEPARR